LEKIILYEKWITNRKGGGPGGAYLDKKPKMLLLSIAILVLIIVSIVLVVNYLGRSDEITIAGSTTIYPIMERAADEYMAEHPGLKIYVMGGSSGYGIKAVLSGKIDIGCVSRELTDQERVEYCRFRYPPLILTPIARGGIVLITYLGNPIDGLTKEEVKDIYAGRTKNWKELGGEDKKITVIGRIKDSGTRDVFKGKIMGGKKLTGEIIERSSNDAVMDTIFANEGAIGYVSLGHVDPRKVEVLTLNGIKPSIESISNGSYPIVRTLYMVTKGEPKGLEREFIDFILSEKGQRIIEEGGFVSI